MNIFLSFQASLLSEQTRKKIELVTVIIAILSFILHLTLIGLVHLKLIQFNDDAHLLSNPIAAIYTPFSFILIYEVYLLVFYLPKSISTYIGKQYEIMTLIIIRRVFKDLSKLEFTPAWFKVHNDLQFTYDLIGALILFFLIYLFYRLCPRPEEMEKKKGELSLEMSQFIKMKNIIAMCLVPTFFALSIYSLIDWVYENFFLVHQITDAVTDVNKIFFDKCFTILILTDVLLLLISFLQTDKFSKVIRNSGFVISTILIKLSFGTDGLLNTVLIVVAVLFGVAILGIHNRHEKLLIPPVVE